jgi:hypothetical protein
VRVAWAEHVLALDAKDPLGGIRKHTETDNRRDAALETGTIKYYAWRYRMLGASRSTAAGISRILWNRAILVRSGANDPVWGRLGFVN